MQARIVERRIELARNAEEKKPLLQRLSRVEGQVRGLKAMIEEDRYCLDEIQQINAMTAAMREVALLLIGQHVSEGAQMATTSSDADAVVDDVMRVLRAALRTRE